MICEHKVGRDRSGLPEVANKVSVTIGRKGGAITYFSFWRICHVEHPSLRPPFRVDKGRVHRRRSNLLRRQRSCIVALVACGIEYPVKRKKRKGVNKLLVAFLTRHKRSSSLSVLSAATENRQNNEAKKSAVIMYKKYENHQ